MKHSHPRKHNILQAHLFRDLNKWTATCSEIVMVHLYKLIICLWKIYAQKFCNAQDTSICYLISLLKKSFFTKQKYHVYTTILIIYLKQVLSLFICIIYAKNIMQYTLWCRNETDVQGNMIYCKHTWLVISTSELSVAVELSLAVEHSRCTCTNWSFCLMMKWVCIYTTMNGIHQYAVLLHMYTQQSFLTSKAENWSVKAKNASNTLNIAASVLVMEITCLCKHTFKCLWMYMHDNLFCLTLFVVN